MTREEKKQTIDELAGKLANSSYFYLTDSSALTVETINKFRRLCFQRKVEFRVVKNTLLKKAMEQVDAHAYVDLYPSLAVQHQCFLQIPEMYRPSSFRNLESLVKSPC